MNSTYIIGEIGQNHNGSLGLAYQLIDMAVSPVVDECFGEQLVGISAVKFTKRDLKNEMTTTMYNQEYDSPHAFGRTYGEHRQALELTDEEHFALYKYAKSKGIDFIETICSESCLSLLELFRPDYIKIASRDLTNLPLIEAVANTRIPMILSTGMGGDYEIDKAYEIIRRFHNNLSILHCVSEYPLKYKNVNLRSIPYLKQRYGFPIGYSDHTIGVSIPVAAVAMGAEIIEKHITLDRTMKGTDQKGSLGPEGLNRLIRNIRLLEMSMGRCDNFINADVLGAKVKLERSVASKHSMEVGHIITKDDIHLLSPGTGTCWSERGLIIGKRLSRGIEANEIIRWDHIIEE